MVNDERRGLRGRDLVGLGGVFTGCIVLGLVIGYLVDQEAGTMPLFTLVGIGAGIVGGALGFWVRVRGFLRP